MKLPHKVTRPVDQKNTNFPTKKNKKPDIRKKRGKGKKIEMEENTK